MTKEMSSTLPGVCNAEACIEKLGPNILFIVERNLDNQIVVYTYELSPDKRSIKGITTHWTSYDNLSERSEMSDTTRRMFYGVTSLEEIKLGHYRMRIACIPEDDEKMFIDLHIKKSGKVVPKVAIAGKECTLLKIYTDLTTLPPKLNGLWAVGKFKDEYHSHKYEVDGGVMQKFSLDFPSMV